MKTVCFVSPVPTIGAGDWSGEYVPAVVAQQMLDALRRVRDVVIDSADDLSNTDFYEAEHYQIRSAIAAAEGWNNVARYVSPQQEVKA